MKEVSQRTSKEMVKASTIILIKMFMKANSKKIRDLVKVT